MPLPPEVTRKPYEMRIKLISAEGRCPNGHKVGDEFWVKGKTPKPEMCLAAFCNLVTPLRILETGGSYPMYPDPESYQTTCPDMKNRLVWEIRRFPNTDLVEHKEEDK